MTRCVLVELDYKALEAQLVGYLAGDMDYLKAAKLGVHAILQSHVVGSPIDLKQPDADIKRIIKVLKHDDPDMYDTCKHVVHGSNYLGTPKKMRMEFPEAFSSVGAAKKMQDLYFITIAKKVKRWQQRTLYEAYQQHYLETVFGVRHYFWDVLHYRGNQLEWGTDAKKAVAFRPQSMGASILTRAITRLKKYPEVFRMLRQLIHDSIVAEVPEDDRLPVSVGIIKACMEAPFEELGGLSVEVEVKIGYNLGEMRDYI